MGTIISPIKDIENIRWTQLRKGRVQDAKRVLAIDDGTSAIIELSNGSYTVVGGRHGPNGNYSVVGYGVERLSQAVLNGLVRIGVLDKKQVAQHIATTKERSDARHRKQALSYLRKLCKEHNIPIPKEALE